MNVLPVWRKGYKGQGITIGIVDDGLEVNNPDLNPNFSARLSYDMNYNRPGLHQLATVSALILGTQDPTPADLLDTHGTEAAGVAAAVANSRCGVGSAFAYVLRLKTGRAEGSPSGLELQVSRSWEDPLTTPGRLQGLDINARAMLGKETIFIAAAGDPLMMANG